MYILVVHMCTTVFLEKYIILLKSCFYIIIFESIVQLPL